MTSAQEPPSLKGRQSANVLFVPRMSEASQEIKGWKTVRLPAGNPHSCPQVEPARRVQPAGMAGAAGKLCECPCSRGRPADNTPVRAEGRMGYAQSASRGWSKKASLLYSPEGAPFWAPREPTAVTPLLEPLSILWAARTRHALDFPRARRDLL